MNAGPPDSQEPRRWLDFAREGLAYGKAGIAEHPRPAEGLTHPAPYFEIRALR